MTDLPAGRALDALVAEKVMGFDGKHSWDQEGWCEYCDEEEFMYSRMRWEQSDRTQPKPLKTSCPGKPYSTSIEAAWEVVEKLTHDLKAGHDKFRIEYFPCGPYSHWTAGFTEDAGMHYDAGEDTFDEKRSAEADTVPLAIVRAALKALGVK